MPIGGTGHACRGYIGVCRCIGGVLVSIGVYLRGTLGQPSSTNPNGGLLGAALWPWGSLALGMLLRFPPSLGPPLRVGRPRSPDLPSSPCGLAAVPSHWPLAGHWMAHTAPGGKQQGGGGGRFHSTPGLPSKGEPTGGGLGGTCRCSGTRRKPGMSTAAHTA